MKPLIIYHGKCADGFTAAWLANIWFARKLDPDVIAPDDWVVDHHAAIYGEAPPDVKDREVFILDFSYPRAVMLEIANSAKHVTVIDHHVTAIDDMVGFHHPNVNLFMSNDRSGAYLTSMFFWPEREPTTMVALVDDRDRWVFSDARTKAFGAGLFSRPMKIGEWNKAALNVEGLTAVGKTLLEKQAKDVADLLDSCMIVTGFLGHMVPVANLPYMSVSDACAEMLARVPDAQFAVAWFLRKDGKFVYSLRSRNGSDVDVSVIAKRMGGGGHKHAAGFAVDKNVTL